MMTFDTILVSRDETEPSVAILTLNRPEAMNSFNLAMHRELQSAYKALDADPSVRVIVVTGAGRAFGAAVGVGATMTMPMDIRICSERSKWAFPFARRGIVCDGAASWFLPRLVGWAKANEWILRASILTADEMQRAGYVSEVQPVENVLSRALELARDIAVNCSPTSTANNKRLLRQSMMGYGALEEAAFAAHMTESRMLNAAFVSADCEEGVRAFLEKRAPKFADRT